MIVSGKQAKPMAAAVFALTLAFAQPVLADFQTRINLSLDQQNIEIPFESGTISFRASWPQSAARWPSGVAVEIPGHDVGHAMIGDISEDLAWINYGQWVGVTRLQRSDAAPSILFEAYTGGAHCCSVLVVLTPIGGKLQSIDFRHAEGELRAELPVDIDGDGILDIVREAELVCKGGECSHRTAIYNIRAGRLYDVTEESAFAAFLSGLDKDEQVPTCETVP